MKLTDENGENITTSSSVGVINKMEHSLTVNQMKAVIDEIQKERLSEFRNIFTGIQCIKDWSGIAPDNGYVILCGAKFYDHLQKQQSK